MIPLLYLAAFMAVAVGFAHSYLGERHILMRLLRRHDLPKLFGDQTFTAHTLRFAWHVTTLAWWGFAAIIVLIARQALSVQSVAWVLASTFLLTAAVTFIVSRGRHLAWPVFAFIGGVCMLAALG